MTFRGPLLPAALCGLLVFCWAGPGRAIDWDGKIRQYARQLKDPSARVRRAALQKLAQLPVGVSSRYILLSLADPDLNMQREAAQIAVERKLPGALPVFGRWLANWDERVRVVAARSLGDYGDASMARPLIRTLSDPDHKVRLAAVHALGKLKVAGRKEIIPLLGRLNDTSAQVRQAVVEVLGRKQDRRVVIPLIGRIQDNSSAVRRAVARALGQLGDKGAGPTLARMCRDNSHDVARAAVEALGELRFDGATELLIDLLQRGPVRVREQAALALGQLGSPRALAALAAALRSVALRKAARKALVSVGAAAAPQLNELLRDPRTPRAVALAAVRVASAGRVRAATDQLVAQLRLGRLPRTLLIAALGRIGDPRAQRPLLEQLESQNHEVRAAALAALEGVVDARAGEPLLPLLADENLQIRLRTVRLLGRLRARVATARLMALARGKDRKLVRAAVRALGQVGDARAVPTLVASLRAPDRQTRRLAGQALALLRNTAAAGAVLRLCKESGGARRVSCIQALGGVLRGTRGDAAADKYLASMLASQDRSAFFATMDAVSAMRAPSMPRRLMRRYRSLDLIQQRRVVQALGNHPAAARSSLSFLLRVLRSPDPGLRAAAAWSLGQLGAAAALVPLQKATRDRHWSVQVNAAASLARMRSRKTASLLRGLTAARNPHVRANALLGLAWLGDRGAVQKLLLDRLSSDYSPWVRLNAARGLRALGVAPIQLSAELRFTSFGELARHLAQKDPDHRVRSVARELLLPPGTRHAGRDWIVLFLLDHDRKPMRNTQVLLVTPTGLVKAAASDPLGEVWEEGVGQGRCHVEAPRLMAR